MGQRRQHGLRQPAFAGLALLLLGFVQVEQLLHSLVVEHHICPEHGDVLHGAAHDEVAELGARGLAAVLTAVQLDVEHDGCLEMIGPETGVHGSAQLARDHIALSGPLPAKAPWPPRRGVLADAPKTSPPA